MPTIAAAVDQVMSQQLHGLRDHLGALGGAAATVPQDNDPAQADEASLEDQIDALDGAG